MLRFPRLKKLLRTNAGFALLEVIIAASIVGIVAGGVATMTGNMLKQQKQANLTATASMIFRQLSANMNNDIAWQKMVNANASLTCLKSGSCPSQTITATNGASCAVNATGANCGGQAVQRITNVLDSDGNAYYNYNTYNANSGYTSNGNPCGTFAWDHVNGNDQCPLHYDVFWWATCESGAGSCPDPQVHLMIRPTFNPGKNTPVNFNPDSYGTWNYNRGSEPFNAYQASMNPDARSTAARAFTCDWIFDPAFFYLSEACAHAGLWNTAAPNAEFFIQQNGAYAQEWYRPNSATAPTVYTRAFMDAGKLDGVPTLSLNAPLSMSIGGLGTQTYVGGAVVAQPAVADNHLFLEGPNPTGSGRLAGQVGIGLPTGVYPNATADVNGMMHISGAGTAQSYTNAQGSYFQWNNLNFQGGTPIAGETDFINDRGLGVGGWGYFNAADTKHPLMFLTAAGDLGINTNNPDTRLEVVPAGMSLGVRPAGWGAGVHTYDMVGEGSIGAGTPGVAAYGLVGGMSSYISRYGAYFSRNPGTTLPLVNPLIIFNTMTVQGETDVNADVWAGRINLQPGAVLQFRTPGRKPAEMTHLPDPNTCAGDALIHWGSEGFNCKVVTGPCKVTYTTTYTTGVPPNQIVHTVPHVGYTGNGPISTCDNATAAIIAAHGNASENWHITGQQ